MGVVLLFVSSQVQCWGCASGCLKSFDIFCLNLLGIDEVRGAVVQTPTNLLNRIAMQINMSEYSICFSYNAVKSRKLNKENLTVLSPGAHMLAAAEAGVFTLVITNPMWVAKTRLCLQYDRYTKGKCRVVMISKSTKI